MRICPWFLALVFSLSVAFTASAQDPLSLTWEVRSGRVEVKVSANEELTRLTMEITPGEGQSAQRAERASLRSGQSWVVSRREPSAPQLWRVDLRGVVRGVDFDAWYEIPVGPLPSLDFTLQSANFREGARWVVVRPDADVSAARLIVRGEDGSVIYEQTQSVSTRAGEDLRVSVPVDEPILTAELLLSAPTGASREYRYVPWELKSEARALNFETGSAAIHDADKAVLDETIALVRGAIERLGEIVPLELYIGGYTDSVGSDASNLALSKTRARAIARYMRDGGIRIPIYTQGFGERAPVQDLGDDAESAANRRAVFLLRSGAPEVSPLFPNDDWQRAH